MLILDDDDVFRNRLLTAMNKKGFISYGASSVAEAEKLVSKSLPKYAVIDLRLNDGNGLKIVSLIFTLKKIHFLKIINPQVMGTILQLIKKMS